MSNTQSCSSEKNKEKSPDGNFEQTVISLPVISSSPRLQQLKLEKLNIKRDPIRAWEEALSLNGLTKRPLKRISNLNGRELNLTELCYPTRG